MRKIICTALAAVMLFASASAEIVIKKDYSGEKTVITVESGGEILSVYDTADNLIYMNDTAETGKFESFAINVSGGIQDFTMYVDLGDTTETADFSVIDPKGSVGDVYGQISQRSDEEKQKLFHEFVEYIMWTDECAYLYAGMTEEEQKSVADAIYAMSQTGGTKNEMRTKISDWFLNEIIMKSSWADLKEIATEQMKIFEDAAVLSDNFNKLSATKQSNVFKNTFAQANNISTKADLIKYLNQYITSEKSSSITSGGGISGGSSSGGKNNGGSSVSVGNSSSYIKPADMTPTSKPEKKEISFNDMQNAAWAEDAVNAMAKKGIIKGYIDGSFKPNNNVTRAEFVAMAVRAFGLVGENEEVFDDVKKEVWYFGAVAAAYREGIITGNGGLFMPESSITREDTAVIISRILDKKEILEEKEPIEFTDTEKISGYATEAVFKLAAAGIISGMPDGSFSPEANLSRAQAAVILHRCMN